MDKKTNLSGNHKVYQNRNW